MPMSQLQNCDSKGPDVCQAVVPNRQPQSCMKAFDRIVGASVHPRSFPTPEYVGVDQEEDNKQYNNPCCACGILSDQVGLSDGK